MADGQHKPNQDDLFQLLGTPEFDEAMAARLGVAKQPNPATKPARVSAERTVQQVLEELHPTTEPTAQPMVSLSPSPEPVTREVDHSRRVTYFTAQRLAAILDVAEHIKTTGRPFTGAPELADRTGIGVDLVRSELLTIGPIGNHGKGYTVNTLIVEIRRVLRLNQSWPVALIGEHPSLAVFLNQDPQFPLVWHVPTPALERDLEAGLVARGVRLVAVATTDFDQAQRAALAALNAKADGVLNASSHHLKGLPKEFPVEPLNIASALRRLAFLAGGGLPEARKEKRRSRMVR